MNFQIDWNKQIPKDELIKQAATILDAGELVIFPTETVYGLGADPCNYESCKKIYLAKGRPSNNPLIIHCADLETIKTIAQTDDLIEKLAKKFWPGPLSLVLPLRHPSKLSPIVNNNSSKICVRIPSHPIALKLILAIKNKMIAAPSANLSNYVSPTKFSHVTKTFPDIFSLDGQDCVYGLESTILDYQESFIKILRHGYITKEQIIEFLEEMNLIDYQKMNSICTNDINETNKIFIKQSNIKIAVTEEKSIITPGSFKKHYSTYTKLVINYDDLNQSHQNQIFDHQTLANRIHINFGKSSENINSIYIKPKIYLTLSDEGNLYEAAKNLYDILRKADTLAVKNNLQLITVAPIPNYSIGVAINDKLNRAQH